MLDFLQIAQEVIALKQLTWAILLTLPAGALAADIYRTVDADGGVTFTDRPENAANAELIEINVRAPGAGDAAAEEESDDEASGPFGAEVPRQATPEELAAQRAENCTHAQQVAETYTIARRLFRDLGNGEREYLSDDEIDQAKAEAQANVATWCN